MQRGERVKPARLGIMIDSLVFEVLGRDNDQLVEAALDLTYGVAAELRRNAHVLSLSTTIQMPLPPSAGRIESVRLWD